MTKITRIVRTAWLSHLFHGNIMSGGSAAKISEDAYSNYSERFSMRRFFVAFLMLFAGVFIPVGAIAQESVKIGLIVPMSGYAHSTGQEIGTAVKLFIQQHGDIVAGRKVEVILRDDGAIADNTKRIAQELITNDKAAVIAGLGTTPSALAVAPLATEAKVIELVMAAATSFVVDKSPYIVRTSSTLAQSSVVMADWAARNGIKNIISIVSDYAPGFEAETAFVDRYKAAGGNLIASLRVPLASADFAPILQHVADAKPEAIFIFIPSAQGPAFIRQFAEKGLDKSEVKILATGDVTGDDELPNMGDAIVGAVTAHYYSASHNSQLNKDYVAGFAKLAPDLRPNFFSVGGYDGIQLIYKALEKTGGKSDADSLIGAVKGMAWESPRGPISIDPETRDIVQNIYMRKVEKVNGQLYNQEFQTFEAVKDPTKRQKN